MLFLPTNFPESRRGYARFALDSQYIDESSNAAFKRYVADQHYLEEIEENHSFWYALWLYSCSCGRSFGLWAFWSVFFAIAFGLGYYFLAQSNAICFNQDLLTRFFYGENQPSLFGCLYYSFVTFTTLGFGDIIPANDLARGIVMLEVILGYVMLGGLISIFANKLARRS